MLQDLIDVAKAHAKQFFDNLRPTSITLVHPSDHPLAGLPAGMLVRKEGQQGAVEYARVDLPVYRPDLKPVVSELVVSHSFGSLDSFQEYLTQKDPDAKGYTLFLYGAEGQEQVMNAMVESMPELGRLTVGFDRHPVFQAWTKRIGLGQDVLLSHEQLADLLDEQKADLKDPTFVPFLLRLRSARTMTYDGKMDNDKSQTVTVAYKIESEGSGNVIIPRDFVVNLPGFIGAWAQGSEPTFEARVRLRVVPPRRSEEGAMPSFRVCFTNAPQWEAEATASLRSTVAGKLSPRTVFNAVPSVVKTADAASDVVTKFGDIVDNGK